MLIGQGRGGKSSLMGRLLGLPNIKSLRHAHARDIITANEQQDKRKGINKNSHSCIKHPTRERRRLYWFFFIYFMLNICECI